MVPLGFRGEWGRDDDILRDLANTERDVILASREQAGIMAQRKKRPTAPWADVRPTPPVSAGAYF